MTPKPRSKNDPTRNTRQARRQAILNAAAVRMGYGSWVKLAGAVRKAMEGDTATGLMMDLSRLLNEADYCLNVSETGSQPPADMLAVAAAYPVKTAERRPRRPQAERQADSPEPA